MLLLQRQQWSRRKMYGVTDSDLAQLVIVHQRLRMQDSCRWWRAWRAWTRMEVRPQGVHNDVTGFGGRGRRQGAAHPRPLRPRRLHKRPTARCYGSHVWSTLSIPNVIILHSVHARLASDSKLHPSRIEEHSRTSTLRRSKVLPNHLPTHTLTSTHSKRRTKLLPYAFCQPSRVHS